MRPLRQGCLLQPKPGRAREERKNVSFSFLLHNAVIDLMPIDTNAQSLGKRQIKPQNRHQSQIKPLLSTSSKTQITSKVLRWQEKVLKKKKKNHRPMASKPTEHMQITWVCGATYQHKINQSWGLFYSWELYAVIMHLRGLFGDSLKATMPFPPFPTTCMVPEMRYFPPYIGRIFCLRGHT